MGWFNWVYAKAPLLIVIPAAMLFMMFAAPIMVGMFIAMMEMCFYVTHLFDCCESWCKTCVRQKDLLKKVKRKSEEEKDKKQKVMLENVWKQIDGKDE